jgi:hypothetical protein
MALFAFSTALEALAAMLNTDKAPQRRKTVEPAPYQRPGMVGKQTADEFWKGNGS